MKELTKEQKIDVLNKSIEKLLDADDRFCTNYLLCFVVPKVLFEHDYITKMCSDANGIVVIYKTIPELAKEIKKEINKHSYHPTNKCIHYDKETQISERVELIERVIKQIQWK